jgi:hypothetical protein
MVTATLESIGHFFLGWPSVSVIVGIVALVIATLEPPVIAAVIPDLRKWAIAVAVVALSLTTIAGKYYDDGLAEKQRQWNAAAAQEIANGNAARAAAVVSVGSVPANRGVFDNDARNRDSKQFGIKPRGTLRGLASHYLLGK